MSEHVERILVATDFSASSRTALERAARIAHGAGAELELLHVIPLRRFSVHRPADGRRVVSDAWEKLHAMAAYARARFDVPVTAHLAIGRAHAEIAARAEAATARLVVAGAHGQRSLRDMFVGSTAQQLQRVLGVPLLIVRRRSVRSRYARALVATDFSAASAHAAHAVASLFPQASLHFVHVCQPLFEGRLAMADAGEGAARAHRNQTLLEAGRALDAFIRAHGLQSRAASAVVKQGYVPGCIRETAVQVGASVVALGASGRSRLVAGILGGVSDEFVFGTGHDVLLAKPTNRRAAGGPEDRGSTDEIEAGSVQA
jgi:nucleotide-binding universal stress UspA family protein